MDKEEVERFKETIIDIHDFIVKKYGGELGVRDEGGVHYCAYRTLFHFHKTKDPFQIGAFVLQDLAQNHYFIDGNKRIAFVMTFFALWKKGKYFTRKYQDSLGFMVEVASKQVTQEDVLDWLRRNTKNL
jgi:death on curing protein